MSMTQMRSFYNIRKLSSPAFNEYIFNPMILNTNDATN